MREKGETPPSSPMTGWMPPWMACRWICAELAAGIRDDAGEVAIECSGTVRGSDAIGKLLLLAGLRDGTWIARGHTALDSKPENIPPCTWHFISSLDLERSSATVESHAGLNFVGLVVSRAEATDAQADGPAFTINMETDCARWLVREITAGHVDGIPKPSVMERALRQFTIPKKGFERAWDKAVRETGRIDLIKAGRKRQHAA